MNIDYNALSFIERPAFSGYQSNIDLATHIIFGVPHDATTSYRPGTREAPAAIREASLNIETYSYFSKRDISELRLHDIGDVILTGSNNEKLAQISSILKYIIELEKIPVMIGGEHSISIPVRDYFNKDVLFIMVDAHGDLREEYLGDNYSHACITRRWLDKIKSSQILQLGIRGQSLDEFEFLKDHPDFIQLSSYDIHNNGMNWALKVLENKINLFEKIYISIDIDGFDPAYAPGTGTPEVMGLSPFEVYNFIHKIPRSKVVGFDLVEVNPNQDSGGITSILAAKTIFELLLLK